MRSLSLVLLWAAVVHADVALPRAALPATAEDGAERLLRRADDEMTRAEQALAAARERREPNAKPDASRVIALCQQVIKEYPASRWLDHAHYLLGYAWVWQGDERQARQAYLTLLCEALPAEAPDRYRGCATPRGTRERLIGEGWLRLGEIHFNEGRFDHAASAYRRALGAPGDGSWRLLARFKFAWSDYRQDHYPEAARGFDALISDARAAQLRSEAVQYLAILFSEGGWKDGLKDDPGARLARFYRKREAEPHVAGVFLVTARTLADQARFSDAIAVCERIEKAWPSSPEAASARQLRAKSARDGRL